MWAWGWASSTAGQRGVALSSTGRTYCQRFPRNFRHLHQKSAKNDNALQLLKTLFPFSKTVQIRQQGVMFQPSHSLVQLQPIFSKRAEISATWQHRRGGVEDSATAEISRSQVWQWIRQAGPRNKIFSCQVLHFFAIEFLLKIFLIFMFLKQRVESQHIQFLAWIESLKST